MGGIMLILKYCGGSILASVWIYVIFLSFSTSVLKNNKKVKNISSSWHLYSWQKKSCFAYRLLYSNKGDYSKVGNSLWCQFRGYEFYIEWLTIKNESFRFDLSTLGRCSLTIVQRSQISIVLVLTQQCFLLSRWLLIFCNSTCHAFRELSSWPSSSFVFRLERLVR